MKAQSLLLSLLILGSQALATQPITGPYISKTLGKPGTDAKWASCLVLPDQVILEDGSGSRITKPAKIDREEMEKAVRGAVSGKLKTGGIHIMATNPAVRVTAGVFPKIQDTLIYEDASRIVLRDNQDARDLLLAAKNLCGKLIAK